MRNQLSQRNKKPEIRQPAAPLIPCTVNPSPDQPQIGMNDMASDPAHAIYCFSHCYNAPLPDDRVSRLTVLQFDATNNCLLPVQQVTLPEGTLMPISQVVNQDRTKLFTTAGSNGIACYHLDPQDQGKVIGDPILLNVTAEPFPTPYGVMPVDICLDLHEKKLFSCNFLAGSLSELSLRTDGGLRGNPRVSLLKHSGVPEKVRRLGPSAAAEELGFPEGFPEDSSHPHGVACHPDGKWLVACDLGTSNLTVYSLPLGDSFDRGEPDFVLRAHQAPDDNRHYLAGTRLVRFSPDGKFLFSVNELDHTLSSYRFDARRGTLFACGKPQMTIPQAWLDGIPPRPYMYNAQANYNAGIAVSPDARHVYSSARGHDSIAGFSIVEDGVIEPTDQIRIASGGRTPWSITFLDNDHLLVANQNADDPAARQTGGKHGDPDRIAPAGREPGNLSVFKRNAKTGALHPTGASWEAPHIVSAQVASP